MAVESIAVGSSYTKYLLFNNFWMTARTAHTMGPSPVAPVEGWRSRSCEGSERVPTFEGVDGIRSPTPRWLLRQADDIDTIAARADLRAPAISAETNRLSNGAPRSQPYRSRVGQITQWRAQPRRQISRSHGSGVSEGWRGPTSAGTAQRPRCRSASNRRQVSPSRKIAS